MKTGILRVGGRLLVVLASTVAIECGGSHGDDGLPAASILASRQSAWAIAVDKTSLYWTDFGHGAVMKCAVGGCGGNPTTVAASKQSTPVGIAIDAANVYWTSWDCEPGSCQFLDSKGQLSPSVTGSVMKCPIGGGSPTVVTSVVGSLVAPWSVAVDAASVYWTNLGSGTVMKCPIDGCTAGPTVLAAGQKQPMNIAVDATSVYWTNNGDGSVMACAIGGCGSSPTVLASGDGAFDIAIDGSTLYWTTRSGVMTLVMGGVPARFASSESVSGLAVDASNVYFGANTLMKCAKTGCGDAPTPLVSAQIATSIAVDATSVYWANSHDFSLMKLTPK